MRAAALLCLLTIGEYLLVKLGLQMATVHVSVSPVWPAAGFALACLTLFGRRLWPAIMVGAFLGNLGLETDGSWGFPLGAATANTVEAFVGATLLSYARFVPTFGRVRDVFVFTLYAVGAATALGALVGTVSLFVFGPGDWSLAPVVFGTWWMGDAMGVLVVSPLLLVWGNQQDLVGISAWRATEGVLLIATIAWMAGIVFGTDLLEFYNAFPLAFGIFPLMVWTAFRFGPRVMATVLFVLSCIVIAGTVQGSGPLSGPDVDRRTDLVWSLLGIVTVTWLAMAALVQEWRRAEAALVEHQEELRRSQRLEAIGTLAGGMAHDFNNILSSVVGYTELALPDLPAGSRAHRNLHEVLRATDRARELFDQVLLFSRRRFDVERRTFPLQELVTEALKLLRPTIPRTVSVRTRLDRSAAYVHVNSVQIEQVLLNLGTNAAQAMPAGGVLEIAVDQVECPTSPAPGLSAGPYVRLVMSDTGGGIAAGDLRHVFEPFFSTKAEREGSGLGLAVTQDIVARHLGYLSVTSTVGQGAVFTVLLPAVPSPSVEDVAPVATDGHGGGRVLLLDDEATLVQLGSQMLESLGYEVVPFTAAEDACRAFRENPDSFTAAVTDQLMPHMTGDVVATEMLRIRPDFPIVVCTGFGHALTPERARAIGIREYLRKPFSLEDLAGALRRAVS